MKRFVESVVKTTLGEDKQSKVENVVGVYVGRFQPFHAGHFNTYNDNLEFVFIKKLLLLVIFFYSFIFEFIFYIIFKVLRHHSHAYGRFTFAHSSMGHLFHSPSQYMMDGTTRVQTKNVSNKTPTNK